MLASLNWLRELCPVDAEPRSVAEALTSRGLTVDALVARGEDHALEIDVPANRPDCLGHLGLARELSAAFGVALERTTFAPHAVDGETAAAVRVRIEDGAACSRYTARIVRGVRVGPSPAWVAQRLEVCGLRAINNVVDISNLVLLYTGNPIHFFDLQRIDGATIVVRPAAAGERLVTLDGSEHELSTADLVIADARRAVALAGVMGGADSEIHEETSDVLIEAAWFRPQSVRRTARRLGLQTDASHRFERGVDPEGLTLAQDLAAGWLAELADGRPARGLVDVAGERAAPRSLTLRLAQLERLLGYAPATEAVVEALEALGLQPKRVDDSRLATEVPSWRVDLEREADLVEEVARHCGYGRIPATVVELPQPTVRTRLSELGEHYRDQLAGAGFHEALGYAMIGEDEDRPFLPRATPAALRLTRPIAESLAVLRRSILPGLLRAADLNLRRGATSVRLFEIGHVFLPRAGGEFPEEPSRAGLVWCGPRRPPHWSEATAEVDLFDLTGLVERLLASSSPGLDIRRAAPELDAFHPGLAVAWLAPDGRQLAWGGALHPLLQRDYPLPLWLAEIDLSTLIDEPRPTPQYRPLPRLTPVTRDLALVLAEPTGYDAVLRVLRSVPAPAPVGFEATDRYVGPPLGEDQSSLTVRVTLTPERTTLTEAEIEDYRRALIRTLSGELGVSIRE